MDATVTDTEPLPAVPEEPPAPRMLDSYALTYAFVLMWTLPALFLLGTQPFHSYSFVYAVLLVGPVVLGTVSLLATDRPRPGMRSLLLHSALLTVFATVGSIAFIFGGMLALPLVTGSIASQMNLLGIGAIAVVALLALPLVIVFVRQLRIHAWLRAFVVAIALVVVVSVLYFLVSPSQLMVESFRKDQVVYLVGSLGWYLPGYGAAVAIIRRVGLV